MNEVSDTSCSLTNIPYEGLISLTAKERTQWLRHNYLREDLQSLASRHGLKSGREIASFGAKIFSRVMRLSAMLAHDPFFLPGGSLKYGLARLFHVPKRVYPLHIAGCLEEATKYFTRCVRKRYDANEPCLVFCVPPRKHCMDILDMPLPFGQFAQADAEEMAQLHDRDAIRDYLARYPAGIFRLRIEEYDSPVEHLINSVARFEKGENISPWMWYTSPEAAFLNEHAAIRIDEGYFAQSQYRFPDTDMLARTFPQKADISISVGLCFENIWNAFAIASAHPKSEGADFVACNPFVPFIRARDRILLFEVAHAMEQKGLDIVGYGSGRIRVQAHSLDGRALYAISKSTGTIPQILNAPPKSISEPCSESPLDLLQWWYATGRIQEMLRWDGDVVDALCQSFEGSEYA